MRRILGLVCVLLVFLPAAAAQEVNIERGDACLERPYAEPVGIVTGQPAQVVNWQFGVAIHAAIGTASEASASLPPGALLTILDGPACWYFPQTSNHRTDHRFWYVRDNVNDLEGWLEEYRTGLLTGTQYALQPITDDQPALIPANPLPDTLRFEGRLRWTPIGEPDADKRKAHTVTFADYGYITVDVQVDQPELVNPDAQAGPSPCRVIALLEPGVEVYGSTMQINDQNVERIWVEPGEYEISVGLYYIFSSRARSAGGDITCPDATYTLTLAPAP